MKARLAVLAAAIAAAAGLSACGGSGHKVAHYSSPDQIIAKLHAGGVNVAGAQVDTSPHWAGIAQQVTVVLSPGELSGVLMFANADAAHAWRGLSRSAHGVAVVGDVWAVSLPTSSAQARARSLELAPKVARVLGGDEVR